MEQARYIWDSLKLKNKSKEFVIDILGNPDTLTFETFNTKKKASVNAIVLKYYYDTPCIDGLMSIYDNCWVEIDIDVASNKVKFVGIGCK